MWTLSSVHWHAHQLARAYPNHARKKNNLERNLFHNKNPDLFQNLFHEGLPYIWNAANLSIGKKPGSIEFSHRFKFLSWTGSRRKQTGSCTWGSSPVRAAREEPIQTQRLVASTCSYREGNVAAMLSWASPKSFAKWRQQTQWGNEYALSACVLWFPSLIRWMLYVHGAPVDRL
jgi:hypothetical protein